MIARENWALRYGYCIFQRLGLRNMPVVDDNFRPVGMITKITLMPWWLQLRDDAALMDNMLKSPTQKQRPSADQGNENDAVNITMGDITAAPKKMGHGYSEPPPRAVM